MTKTVAVSMVRDEADVIGSTVRHLLAEVDEILIADNLSTDDTPELLAELVRESGGRLTVIPDADPAYRQSAKMTALALRARLSLGADWIVPFDADEIWYSPFGTIADVLGQVAEQWLVVPAPLYDHVATAQDPVDVDPVRRLGWRRTEANPLPKVACRWREDLVIEQGNHDAHYIGRPTRFDELLVVRHFPYRTPAQLVRKVRNGAAAYAAAGDSLPVMLGAHWRQWGRLLDERGEEAIGDIFREWYWRDDPTSELVRGDEVLPPLIFDPAPYRA